MLKLSTVADAALISGSDVTNAVTLETDCSTPRGIMCWYGEGMHVQDLMLIQFIVLQFVFATINIVNKSMTGRNTIFIINWFSKERKI